jgi:LysM repeat protein
MPEKGTKDLPFITSQELRRLCDYGAPYSGIVDDGKGTSAVLNTSVTTTTTTIDNKIYYSKKAEVAISEVTHVVRKGETLSALSQKFGVPVNEIATANGIRDLSLIHVGDVLHVKVDIRYGYQVDSMIDKDGFSDKAKELGYSKISDNTLYQVLDYTNSFADNLGGSLMENAGKSRMGSNLKLYVEKASGRVFPGNQYVKVYGLKDVGRNITQYTHPKFGKVALPLTLAIEGVEIYDGYRADGNTFGYNTGKQVVGAAGGMTGAYVGAKSFAIGLGMIGGIIFGPIGATVGAIIGGFVGGILGGIYGEKWAEKAYDCIIE